MKQQLSLKDKPQWAKVSQMITKRLSQMPKDSSYYKINHKLLQNSIPDYPAVGALSAAIYYSGHIVSCDVICGSGEAFNFYSNEWAFHFSPLVAEAQVIGGFYINPNTLVGKLDFKIRAAGVQQGAIYFQLSRGEQVVGYFAGTLEGFGLSIIGGTGDFKRFGASKK